MVTVIYVSILPWIDLIRRVHPLAASLSRQRMVVLWVLDSGGKTMVTEATRRAVWNDLLDVSRVARYAESMGSQYRVRHLFIRLGLLVAASGSMATLLDAIGGQWRIGSGLAIAVLIAADFMLDYATKIAVLSSTKRECNVLEAEWRELWLDVDSPESTDAEIRRRNRELVRQFERATSPMDEQVRVSHRTNERCTRAAFTITGERYASSP